MYVIYYNVKDNKRDTERSKFALHIAPNPNDLSKFDVDGWSKKNNKMDLEVTRNLIITQEIEEKILEYNKAWLINKYKYFIGYEIYCSDACGKFDTIKIDLAGDMWNASIYLNPRDIDKCVVTKVNEKSVRADVISLNESWSKSHTFSKWIVEEIIQLVENRKLNVNLKNEYIR